MKTKLFALYAALLAILLLATGCMGFMYPSFKYADPKAHPPLPDKRTDPIGFAREVAYWSGEGHTVSIPAKTNIVVTWRQRANLIWWFGNADEPTAPSWYIPNGHLRNFRWHLRNPLHNFTRGVIGLTYSGSIRSGKHPEFITNPDGGWNVTFVAHGYFRSVAITWKSRKTGWQLMTGPRVDGSGAIEINKKKPETAKKKKLPASNTPDFVEK